MDKKYVSKMTLKRLPIYLNYLNTLPFTTYHISATRMAKDLGLGDVQVRKDLSAVCGLGKPKIGYSVQSLIDCINGYLEVGKIDNVIIAGAGKLGKALLDYNGFLEYGLNISAAFDNNPDIIGTNVCDKPILHIDEISDYCKKNKIKVGIITVPADAAQEVCDKMICGGVTAIMNFAPIHLRANPEIIVQNEHIASSLVLLTKKLKTNKER